MRVPYDPKYKTQILTGAVQVETKSGLPVEILTMSARTADRIDDIIGLVTCANGITQNVQRYYSDGHLISDSTRNGEYDLFVVSPDPPLTEFEKKMAHYVNTYIENSEYITLNEQTRKYSKELMEIARAELFAAIPKWKKANYEMNSDSIDYLVKYTHDGGDGPDWIEVVPANRVHEGEDYLEIDESMLNLPKNIS